MAQGFSENIYLIDLSYVKSPSELVYELSSVLDNELVHNKRIKLRLGDTELNKSQLLSIKSLINSVSSSLAIADGKAEKTRDAALSLGLVFENTAETVAKESAFINEIHEETPVITEITQVEPEYFPETNIAESEITDETSSRQREEELRQAEPEGINTPETEISDTTKIEEEKSVESEKEAGINGLTEETISLDIPDKDVINEELSVIYDTEKKLENVFENTGIKEEKFTSLKDIPTAEEKVYTKHDFELESFPTKYLKQTICTGQYISYEGNLIIIGDCHEGSEISAAGDITVWGELSGSAYAGMNGNEKAGIRALKMNAQQLRIANCYIKRPAALERQSEPKGVSVPEEAAIIKGEIGVYRIYK